VLCSKESGAGALGGSADLGTENAVLNYYYNLKCKECPLSPFPAPIKRSVFVMLAPAPMELRLTFSVRALEALTAPGSGTVSRCVSRVTSALGSLPLSKAQGWLVVDSTRVRAATTELSACSGYKHPRCEKVQLIARPDVQMVVVEQREAWAYAPGRTP
jgi:hypothetical protein